MSIFGDIWDGIKDVGHVVGKIGEAAAPILGMIPGVGTVAGGLIGGASGLIAGDGLSGALKGALGGVSGGLLKGLVGGGSSSSAGSGMPSISYDADGNPIANGSLNAISDGNSALNGGDGSSSGSSLLGGLTGSNVIQGIGTGLTDLQNQSNIEFNQDLATKAQAETQREFDASHALATTSEADTNALGQGNLGVSTANANTTRACDQGTLALNSKTQSDANTIAAGTLGLSTAQAKENQRQFDVNTGVSQEATDYNRQLAQTLATARSKYVSGLAGGQTIAQQNAAQTLAVPAIPAVGAITAPPASSFGGIG